VSPSLVTIFSGQTLQLSAIVTDDRGQVLTGRTVSYVSSDPQVATVSASGLVTGVTAGAVTITATSEGASGTATITVAPEPVFSVVVSPSTATLSVGQPLQLSLIARSATGQVLSLTGRSISWSTSTPAITSVSSSGMVTALSVGTGVVIGTVDGKQASAQITVNAVAQGQVASITISPPSATVNVAWTTTLSATARDLNGNAIPGSTFTWSTSNASIATVSANGVVTGVAPGAATISATSGGKTASASITVQLAPVDHIVVTPSNPTLNVGQTVQLTATLYDQQNNVLTGRPVTWSSEDASKASVSSTGLVTALRKSSVNITASAGGKSGSTTVRIQ
jgi:trimeric autotransporter adhesin